MNGEIFLNTVTRDSESLLVEVIANYNVTSVEITQVGLFLG